jgi:protein gp37
MGEKTGITWTDHTFNPWIGCARVSPGCERCYAETYGNRFDVEWGVKAARRRTSASNWRQPLRWNRQAKADGVRRKVFCASLADVFEDNAQLHQWRFDLFDLIGQCPDLDWLLLTKRIENVMEMIPLASMHNGTLPSNVWIGTTVENQQYADKRIPILLNVPAKIIFLSIEPMLGPIDHVLDGINWVICGGESGIDTRPMNPEWAQSLRDQCISSYVPFFFKQWGAIGGDQTLHHGGDLLDGKQWHQFPTAAQP